MHSRNVNKRNTLSGIEKCYAIVIHVIAVAELRNSSYSECYVIIDFIRYSVMPLPRSFADYKTTALLVVRCLDRQSNVFLRAVI